MGKLESFLFKSISYNMILQISFRLISFVLNAILFRYVHTDLIGACNFRLALLYTSVMFLSREPFRRALPNLNVFSSTGKRFSSFINSLWLVLLNGILISSLFGYLWLQWLEKPNSETVPLYWYSVPLCCLACVIELVGEPSYCLIQMLYLPRIKVIIEAASLLVFNVTFVLLALYRPELGAVSYSIARLLYSIIFSASNCFYAHKHKDKLLAKATLIPSGANIDREYLSYVWAYYSQSICKQLLTEGERYLITMFNMLTFSESGIYDIVNNLGSLFARFIFLPIEDAAYVYFTGSLKRGITYKDQVKEDKSGSHSGAKSHFELLLKSVSLVGIVVLVFGQGYSKLLLKLYGGSALSENEICVNMLRLHCVYIYFLALNGVTECFFNATRSDIELKQHNMRLVLFSVSFMVIAYLFVQFIGIYGFLLANCMNMFIRISISCYYISIYFTGYSYGIKSQDSFDHSSYYNIWSLVLPSFSCCLLLTCSLIAIKSSEFFLDNLLVLHFGIGAFIFLVNVLVIIKQEAQIRSILMSLLSKTRSKAE